MYLQPPAEPSVEESTLHLVHLIRTSPSRPVIRRAQSLLLSLRSQLTATEIAAVVGLSAGTIRNLRVAFRRQGLSVLTAQQQGGRRRASLTRSRERELLSVFLARARSTGRLDVQGLQGAYEHLIGHRCARSTIYRLIQRNGLSGRLPRARRPCHS